MNLLQQAIFFYRTRKQWFGEGAQPAPAPLPQWRTNTCLACPKHDTKHPLELAAKRLVTRRLLDVKRELELHVQREAELALCGMCGCVLETKVFEPLHIARNNTPDWQSFPPNCWLRTEEPTT